ncbi:MAG: polyamine ABC transporter ATP-binding protein [Hyphomicrobiales bacterium]|mgnify:CR=1 FL=1|nr:MAG: polyamine ABC transporter ATP-binding protein [Hyphomicrobiales bacterium]
MTALQTQSSEVVIENLSLSFGATEVLKKIDLVISPGEFFSFLGPSGSGKSTLLRAIAGFGPTPKGRILINGEDVAKLPPWERNVGMVFQSYALWPHMSVARNVAFGLEERKLPRAEIDRRVMEALELVDLVDYAQRRPSQLSGGQQQRVALARTIVIEPRVLLLDEPLSNLDANLRVQMRRDILALQRKLKLTTIFVTHDQEEANTTSQRMAVLNNGILQQVGAPMELYDNPANSFVAGFLGTANILQGAVKSLGDETKFVTAAGLQLPHISAAPDAHSIAIRPQNVHLRAPGTGGALAMAGEVAEVEFLGSILRYAATLGGETLLVDHSHTPGEPVFAVGDTVDVVLDADKFIML